MFIWSQIFQFFPHYNYTPLWRSKNQHHRINKKAPQHKVERSNIWSCNKMGMGEGKAGVDWSIRRSMIGYSVCEFTRAVPRLSMCDTFVGMRENETKTELENVMS